MLGAFDELICVCVFAYKYVIYVDHKHFKEKYATLICFNKNHGNINLKTYFQHHFDYGCMYVGTCP